MSTEKMVSLKEIAEKVGVSENTIRLVAQGMAIQPQSIMAVTEYEAEAVKRII